MKVRNTMTLLDLQGMEWTDEEGAHDSDLSVVCEIEIDGASSLSVTLCDVD
jgi:hypothetical protein